MILQDEIEAEKDEDGFDDIYNEAKPDSEEDIKVDNEFQEFIKKISQPS